MAVQTVTPTALAFNTGQVVTQGSGTAIDASKTMEIAYPKDGKLLIIVDSTHANTAATFSASDVFVAAGKGTTALAVGNGIAKAIIVESDRHKLNDGVVEISWHADSLGFVQAYYLL